MKKSLLFALAALGALAYAGSPSFNCKKAKSIVEMRICQSSELSDLDREMFEVYQKVKDILPKGDQKRWLKRRNSCVTSSHFDRCLADAYRTRIDALHQKGQDYSARQRSSGGGGDERVEYQCNTSDLDMLVAEYHNGGKSPKVSLRFDFKGKPIHKNLRIVPSGSGAKYQGKGVSFWDHHGEATLMIQGRKFVCRELRD